MDERKNVTKRPDDPTFRAKGPNQLPDATDPDTNLSKTGPLIHQRSIEGEDMTIWRADRGPTIVRLGNAVLVSHENPEIAIWLANAYEKRWDVFEAGAPSELSYWAVKPFNGRLEVRKAQSLQMLATGPFERVATDILRREASALLAQHAPHRQSMFIIDKRPETALARQAAYLPDAPIVH